MLERLRKHRWKLQYSFVCIISMIICAGFTSPLYPHYTGLDSSMFLITAKGILNGKIPYIDLFDHKGPVFFWIEALGYACGGRTGVWLLECFFGILDLLLLDRICILFRSKRSTVIVPTAVVFFYLFEHGNLTEELSMPLMLLGTYLELRFLVSQRGKHALGSAFLYGVILGLLAFIRLNNAVVLCALLLCIVIDLIQKKQWTNLLGNILAGVLGLAFITVPICVYFYCKSALNEMLYATFLHNLIYAKNQTHAPILSSYFLYYLTLFTPGIYACIVFMRKWRCERSREFSSLLFATVLTYAMLAYTNVYAHYYVLGLPLFAVAIAVCEESNSLSDVWEKAIRVVSKSRNNVREALSAFLVFFTVLYAGLSMYSACAPIYKTYLTDIAYDEYAEVQKGISIVPDNERDSLIAYDILADFYYHADIVPCYKYYTLQRWMTSEKVNVNQDFMDYISNEHPLWVVIPSGDNNQNLNKILSSYYICKYEDAVYSFYRLKE